MALLFLKGVNNMNIKKIIAGIIALTIAMTMFVSCKDSESSSSDSSTVTTSGEEKPSQGNPTNDSSTTGEVVTPLSSTDKVTDRDKDSSWDEATATKITFDGKSANVSGSGATASGGIATITKEGTYVVSGTVSDGQIVIDATSEEKIQLVLNGVDITSSKSSAIYVKQADKVFITLAKDTTNKLTDGTSYTFDDVENEEPDAVVFSKDDLTINGEGKLVVNANYKDAIASKDELVIVSGVYEVNSVGNGIKGKDDVIIVGGEFSIKSGGDCVKSTNADEEGLGYMIIEGGSFKLNSAEDAIQAEKELTISGGSFDITTTGTVATGGNDNMGWGGRGENKPQGKRDFADTQGDMINNVSLKTQESTDAASDDASSKGIKAGSMLAVSGGTFTLNTTDHAVHGSDAMTISGGEFSISSSSGKGISVHGDLTISGGKINIAKATEGVESKAIMTISGGEMNITASDDGLNAGGGVSLGMGAKGQTEQGMETGTHLITISGGSIFVNANGDGIDSNGDINVTGGTVVVSGPIERNNSPLDCGDSRNAIRVSGGVLIAGGSTGMFEAPSSESTQNSIYSLSVSAEADTLVTLADSSGNVIAAFKVPKHTSGIVFSLPEIKNGTQYHIYTGGTYSGTLDANGYGTGGTISDGKDIGNCTVSAIISAIGSGTVSGNKPGNFGGKQ